MRSMEERHPERPPGHPERGRVPRNAVPCPAREGLGERAIRRRVPAHQAIRRREHERGPRHEGEPDRYLCALQDVALRFLPATFISRIPSWRRRITAFFWRSLYLACDASPSSLEIG